MRIRKNPLQKSVSLFDVATHGVAFFLPLYWSLRAQRHQGGVEQAAAQSMMVIKKATIRSPCVVSLMPRNGLLVELFDGLTQLDHDALGGIRNIIGLVFAQIVIAGQRLTGEGVQEGFAQQLTVGGVTEIVDLTACPLIGKDLEHLERDRDSYFLDLFALFAVFGIGTDIIAVPLCLHHAPVIWLFRRDFNPYSQ